MFQEITDPEVLSSLENRPTNSQGAAPKGASPVSEEMGFFEEIGQGAAAGFDRLAAGARKTMSSVADYAGEEEEYSRYSQRRASQNLKAAQEKEKNLGLTGSIASMAVQSLPTAASFILPGGVPAKMAAAGMIGAGQEFGDIMIRGEEEGRKVDARDALQAAAGAGVVDAAIGRFLPTGGSPARRIVSDAIGGAISGSQHQIASNLAVGADWNENIGSAALGGGVAAGGLSGLNSALQIKLNKGGENAVKDLRLAKEANNNVNPSESFKSDYFEHANASDDFKEKIYAARDADEVNSAIDQKFGLDEQYGATTAFMRAQKLADKHNVPLTDAAYRWDLENLTKTKSSGNAGEAVGISTDSQSSAAKKNEGVGPTTLRGRKAQAAGETAESHRAQVKEQGIKALAEAKGVFHNNFGIIQDMYKSYSKAGTVDKVTLEQYSSLANDLSQLEQLMQKIVSGKKEDVGDTAVLVAKRAYKQAADLGLLGKLKGVDGDFDPLVDIQSADFLERMLVKEYPSYHQGSPDLAKERDSQMFSRTDLIVGYGSPAVLAAKKAGEAVANNVGGYLRQRGMRKRKEEGVAKREELRRSLSRELAARPKRPTMESALQENDLSKAADIAEANLNEVEGVSTTPVVAEPQNVVEAPTGPVPFERTSGTIPAREASRGRKEAPEEVVTEGVVEPAKFERETQAVPAQKIVKEEVVPEPEVATPAPKERIPVTKLYSDTIEELEKVRKSERTPDQVIAIRRNKEMLEKTNDMLNKVAEETREDVELLSSLMGEKNIDPMDKLAVKKLKNALKEHKEAKAKEAVAAAKKVTDEAREALQPTKRVSPQERIAQKNADMESWNKENSIPEDIQAEAKRRLGYRDGEDFNVQALRKEQSKILSERAKDGSVGKTKYSQKDAQRNLSALAKKLGLSTEEGNKVALRGLEGLSEVSDLQYNRLAQKLYQMIERKAEAAKKALQREELEAEKLRREYEVANSSPKGMSEKTKAAMLRIQKRQEAKVEAAKMEADRLAKSQEEGNRRAAVIVEALEKARKEQEAAKELARKVEVLGEQEALVRKRMEDLGADKDSVDRFIEDNFSLRTEPLKEQSLQGLFKAAGREAEKSKSAVSAQNKALDAVRLKTEQFIAEGDIEASKALLRELTVNFHTLMQGKTKELEIIAKQLEAFQNASDSVKKKLGTDTLAVGKAMMEAFEKAAEMKAAYPDNPEYWFSQDTYQKVKDAFVGSESYSSYVGDLGKRLRAGIFGDTSVGKERKSDAKIAEEIRAKGGEVKTNPKPKQTAVITKTGKSVPVKPKQSNPEVSEFTGIAKEVAKVAGTKGNVKQTKAYKDWAKANPEKAAKYEAFKSKYGR